MNMQVIRDVCTCVSSSQIHHGCNDGATFEVVGRWEFSEDIMRHLSINELMILTKDSIVNVYPIWYISVGYLGWNNVELLANCLRLEAPNCQEEIAQWGRNWNASG